MSELNNYPLWILELCNNELQLELEISNGMIVDAQFGKADT